MKLSEAMRERMLLSFELFPPKTEKGMDNLPGTIDHLMKYKPAYISCTYGAGGGNVGANREVCQMIKKAGTTPVTHFTVIKNTKEGIKEQLDQYLAEGVDHMLALRGDIPLGETTTCGDFNYATDLVKFVRDEFGDKFEIAVAGSPEGHIACRSLDADIAVLRQKQDNGADYIMTQLCWDMEQFKYWLDSIREAGVTMPVDVGVMPILDMSATINMALSRNGCVMDRELCRLISRNWLFPNPFAAKDSDGKPFDMFYDDKIKRFKEEGIEYTIRQIDEYRALGVEPPIFGHLPLINGPDGKKLSKRHGSVAVTEYKKAGYLPEAIFNYLARLGWGHGNMEKFTREELAKVFVLSDCSRAAARMDFKKLAWLNGQYMKEADDSRLADLVKDRIVARGGDLSKADLVKDCALLKSRAQTLEELADDAMVFYGPYTPVAEDIAKSLENGGREAASLALKKLEALPEWKAADIYAVLKSVCDEQGVKFGVIATPIRVIATAAKKVPQIDQTLEIIGRDAVISRLRENLA